MADTVPLRKRLSCYPEEHVDSAGLATTSHYRLPADFVEKAVRRLGWVSIVYAVFFLSMWILYRLSPTGAALSDADRHFYAASTLLGVVLGGGMAVFTFVGRASLYAKLDAGLLFQVLGALLISVAETHSPLKPGEVIRGHSSVSVWLVFFALLVPGCKLRAPLAAALTALMAPLGMLVSMRWYGVPAPSAEQWALLYGPTFITAAVTVPLAGVVYNLGAQVSRARDMGSYEMTGMIGRGGMGEVWRARHRLLARPAAIKLIRPESLYGHEVQQADARRRFEREAKAIASLQSPNTVTLFDYGANQEGTFYYVMELLDGLDLETFVNRHGPVPADRAIYVLRQICDSLAEAHSLGLTHRDIKPRNIMLCRFGLRYDFVKVLDFGLAKFKDARSEVQLTQEGITTGTPAFMAPEMATAAATVDGRADIYALGCVAYWLLTGKLVFEASTPLAMVLAHVQTPPVPPSLRSEMEIPEPLERLILQCLSKDPAQRPPSVRLVAKELAAMAPPGGWDDAKAEDWWTIHYPGKVDAGFSQPDPESAAVTAAV